MKTTKAMRSFKLLSLFTSGLFLIACGDDDMPQDVPENQAAEINYGVSLVGGAGDVITSYLLGLENLDMSEINNNNSTEVGQFTSIYSDGNAMFTAGFGAPATMGKYIFNDEGQAELDQEIIVPGSNSFSTVEIVSSTRGYATVGGGISKIIEFNPETMRITGEVDLSSAGEGLFYSDLIARENDLFLTINDFGGSGEAMIGVINMDSNSLEKVIRDSRTATFFNTLTASIMDIDDKGDLYVMGSGLYSGKPSGVLRINSGETEFDESYFLDLGSVDSKTYFGLYLVDENTAITAMSEDDDNFFGNDGTSPSFRYRKINLNSAQDQEDLSAELPNTFAASRSIFVKQVSDNGFVFPIAGVDEDALYRYDVASGNVTRDFSSSGGYISGFIQLNRE